MFASLCADEFVVETVVSSSEFIVDDVNARNFNDKTFGSSVVLKSPIELHNAYFAAGVLAAAIFIVAVVVSSSARAHTHREIPQHIIYTYIYIHIQFTSGPLSKRLLTKRGKLYFAVFENCARQHCIFIFMF